jgi:undecaprenyl-diphosphatase
MTWLEALFIGFVQDISEFFPISSTALMLIVQRLLHITIGEDFKLAFESLLHIASVLAVIVYFRQDLRQIFVDFIRYIWLKNHDARRNYRFTLFNHHFNTYYTVYSFSLRIFSW